MRSVSFPPTILVVEDDNLVRMVGADMLVDAGYDVVEAANADQALEILEDREIALLFSDIDMPGSMDGLGLAQLVHLRWPAVRLLLTSGKHRPSSHELPDKGQFVAKPYDQTQLIAGIRGQLD